MRGRVLRRESIEGESKEGESIEGGSITWAPLIRSAFIFHSNVGGERGNETGIGQLGIDSLSTLVLQLYVRRLGGNRKF